MLAGASVLGAIALLVKSNLKGILRVAVPGILIVVAVLLRAIDAKFWGVVAMGGTVVILFFLPWLDHSPVKSIRYRPTAQVDLRHLHGQLPRPGLHRHAAAQPAAEPDVADRHAAVPAFFFLMPVWSRLGTFKPVPERVTFQPH